MKKKSFFGFAAAILLAAGLWSALPQPMRAQNSGIGYERGATQTERILPPSPEAASAVRYADVPFTHSLGLAEYTVPVYELSGRQLRLPIALQYRSGGIRVDEIAGVAGLGWTLQAGGCITREVVYMPDEFTSPLQAGPTFYRMPTADELSALQADPHPGSGAGAALLLQILHGQRDCSPDRYSYSVCGLSGTFIMTPEGTVEQLTGDGVLLSYDSTARTFTLTGPDGTVYTLGGADAVEWGKRKNPPVMNATPETGQQVDWEAVTAWHLTRITSRDGTESATLTYADGGTWHRDVTTRTSALSVSDPSGNRSYSQISVGTPQATHVQSEHRVKVLTGISLGYYTATFTYAATSESEHVLHAQREGDTPAYNHPMRLSRITVSAGSPLLRLNVGTKADPVDGRIVLDSLRLYRGGVLDDRWDFTYRSAAQSGSYRQRVHRLSQDWYGYYNAEMDGHPVPDGYPEASTRTWLCPYTFGHGAGITKTLNHGRPDPSAAALLMLSAADHDGAVTTWEYEGNRVPLPPGAVSFDGQPLDSVSIGVRVRSIAVRDGSDTVRIRTFRYAEPAVTADVTPLPGKYLDVSAAQVPVTSTTSSGQSLVTGITYAWSYSAHESPVGEGTTLQGASVVYGLVTEDVSGTGAAQGSARTVYRYDTSDMICPYTNHGEMFPQRWASVYQYQTPTGYGGMNPMDGVHTGYWKEVSGGSALLLSRETYARDAQTGTFNKVAAEVYSYHAGASSEVMTGYRVQQVMDPYGSAGESGNVSGEDCIHYPVYTQCRLTRPVTVQTTVGYHQVPGAHGFVATNDTVTVSTQYVPRGTCASPLRVRRRIQSTSGGLRSVSYAYPDDLTGAGYAALAGAHALSDPVRTRWYSGPESGVPATEVTTDYALFHDIWQPSSVVERTRGTESHRLSILARDSYGNIADYKETGAPRTTVLWSYGGVHPVAVVRNAKLQDVASAAGGQSRLDQLALASYLNTASQALLAGLRTSLPEAHVTILQWTCGKGLSARTEPDGVALSYEYDHAGRLLAVVDADGHTEQGWEYDLYDGPAGDGRRSVRHKVYRSAAGLAASTDVTWFNTLGMRVQDIALEGSGDGRDLVYPREGDFLLHDDVKLWLPYAEDTEGGQFQLSATMESVIAHNSSKPYTYNGYEISSRDRVLETALPGYDGTAHKTVFLDNTLSSLPVLVWQDGTGVVTTGTWKRSELRAAWSRDADGRIQATVTDPLGRTLLTQERSPLDESLSPDQPGSRVLYVYDAQDRLRAVAGPGIALTDTLNMWRYGYDAHGRVASKGIPGVPRERYTYDAEDRVIAVDRADGSRTETDYDAFGRVTAVRLRPSPDQTPVLLERHWWDEYPDEAASLVTMQGSGAPAQDLYTRRVQGLETMSLRRVTGPDGVPADSVLTVTVYDGKSRPVNALTKWGPGRYSLVRTAYCFDGQPEQVVHRSVESDGTHDLVVDYAYDGRGRLLREVSVLSDETGEVSRDTTVYAYDLQGRPAGRTSQAAGSAHRITLADTYTLQGWLSERTWSRDGAQLLRETLRYDSGLTSSVAPRHTGMIAERTDLFSAAGANAPGAITDAYTYDSRGRLTRDERWYGATASGTAVTGEAFTYDARGNILSRQPLSAGPAGGGPTLSFTYDGDRLSSIAGGAVTPWTFTHDVLGRMTRDGRSGQEIAYNHLDLPRKITKNAAVLGNYSYLSDGTLVETVRGDGSGLVRRGLLTYRKSSGGSLSFEGADFCAGRMTCGEVLYDVTDHLGSVRSAVVGSSGSAKTYAWYGAYGSRTLARVTVPPSPEPSYRYGFTGKEDQSTEFGIPYTDFGARHFSPDLGRWLTPDPLSEKYYGISPYAYCNGDPVNLVDKDGNNPIYSTEGYLLGTDDNGLQGDAIIMESQYFHQGMSPDEALEYHLGAEGLIDSDAESRFNDSYNSLSSRPDWDGYLTLAEANEWFRNGNGQPLYVSLDKIDLSGLVSLGDEYVGQEKYINLFFASGCLNDALVYGTIKLTRYPFDAVRANADFYDFDIKPWNSFSTIGRNLQTIIGSKVAGQGVGYQINIYGSKKLRRIPSI